MVLFWRHAWAAMQEVLWEDGKHVRFDATASLQAGHTFPDCKHMRFDASKQASRSHISADTCASILGEGHASQKRLLPFLSSKVGEKDWNSEQEWPANVGWNKKSMILAPLEMMLWGKTGQQQQGKES